MTQAIFKLAGQIINPPVDWQGIRVITRFDNDSVEGNTEIDNFRFVNEAAQIIRNHIDNGDIFQSIPFSIELVDDAGQIRIFNGYVNTANALRILTPNDISARIAKLDSLSDLSAKIAGITFEMLREKGLITTADYVGVPYVVEKEFNPAEFAVLALSVFMMTKIIADEARAVSLEIAQIIAIAGAGITGSVAAFILSIALVLIRIAFAIAMVIALAKLIQQLFDYIYPIERVEYGMTFNRMLEKICEHEGYTFSSPITELNRIYLPSKPEGGSTNSQGIPNPTDYGYRASELWDLVKQMHEARFRVDEVNKVVELRALNDPFWRQPSPWVKPDVLNETKVYNTDQVVNTRLVTFAVDQSDFYTIENYRGTAYEVTTQLTNPPTNKDLNGVTGLDEIRIPLALSTRKEGLSEIEELLKATIAGVNKVLTLFGGQGFKNKVANRVGLMKKGARYHYLPKLVLLENGRIPKGYRDLMSAKYYYDTFIDHRSLVADNFYQQALVVEGEKNGFTMIDFLTVGKNKYFVLADGRDADMTSIEWGFDQDEALLSYKIHEIYSDKITESGNEIT